MSRSNETKIFVGNLPRDIRTREIKDLFHKYGPVRYVDLKGLSTGTPFAFVEFDDPRDARDAVKYRDGYDFDGFRLRVEFQKGFGRDRDRYSRRGQPPKRSEYRVLISGLPPSGSWQDVKDHVRKAGDVVYADVYKDGTGVIEFAHREDMKRAVRDLNNSKFRSHEGESSVITLKEQGKSARSSSSYSSRRSRSRSSSRSRGKSRSRSRSSRSRSASKSRSRSVSKDEKRETKNQQVSDRSKSKGSSASDDRSPAKKSNDVSDARNNSRSSSRSARDDNSSKGSSE